MLNKGFEENILHSKDAFAFFLDIGCATSASDPQVYVRLLAVVHRLERNVSFSFLEPSMSKEWSVECYPFVEEN